MNTDQPEPRTIFFRRIETQSESRTREININPPYNSIHFHVQGHKSANVACRETPNYFFSKGQAFQIKKIKVDKVFMFYPAKFFKVSSLPHFVSTPIIRFAQHYDHPICVRPNNDRKGTWSNNRNNNQFGTGLIKFKCPGLQIANCGILLNTITIIPFIQKLN